MAFDKNIWVHDISLFISQFRRRKPVVMISKSGHHDALHTQFHFKQFFYVIIFILFSNLHNFTAFDYIFWTHLNIISHYHATVSRNAIIPQHFLLHNIPQENCPFVFCSVFVCILFVARKCMNFMQALFSGISLWLRNIGTQLVWYNPIFKYLIYFESLCVIFLDKWQDYIE